ncbi:MAG: hypothetical protein JW819_11845 [Candidatus Krumholzibacteriota bacterium]|nr:hypothetical protein [Candidatus Krumholzibacteriota bacterium]
MRRLTRVLTILALAAALGCSTEQLLDITPPPQPVAALISITIAGGGMLTVAGEPGAVEADATVEARNLDADGMVIVRESAGSDGAFSLGIAGEYLDEIMIQAIDAAGNISPSITLHAGEPFGLVAVSGDGQSATVATALADSLVFQVEDGGGAVVPGVAVIFALTAGAGTFSPETTLTDAAGRAASRLTLGEVAGALTVAPYGQELSFTTAATMTATALAGPPASLAWVGGVGQKDAPSVTLADSLTLQVHDAYGNPVTGPAVTFTASVGGSASPAGGVADGAGNLRVAWTLGGAHGTQLLTATAAGLDPVDAAAVADHGPVLDYFNPTTPVDNLDLLDIYGDNFCETPAYNDLRLGGLAMTIVTATETHLKARVPAEIEEGDHDLTLAVGSQSASPPLVVSVTQPLGQVEDHPFVHGAVDVEFRVPTSGTSYAVIPYSLNQDGPDDPQSWAVAMQALAMGGGEPAAEDALARFHRQRLSLQGFGADGDLPPLPPRGRSDEHATFYVLADIYGYTHEAVDATRRYEGANTIIYVDDTTPVGNVPDLKIEALGDCFDQQDYLTDVTAFGAPSDIDDNDKVIVLLTPVVNSLSDDPGIPPGAYIGGYFYAPDLDIFYGPVSNHAEIFYGLVPDPSGEFSQVPHTVDGAFAALAPILAHEFQHMINAGQRHIIQGTPSTPEEELWLNEGLSHLAENLCGYDDQNVGRVKLFLHTRATRYTSLTLGGNALAERGAAYLFCRYLLDRFGAATAGALIGGPESGAANVAQATGETFAQLFKDWAAAIYLDDRDLDDDGFADDLGPAYRFTSHNLRLDYPYGAAPGEALAVLPVYFDDPAHGDVVHPTAADYLIFEVESGHAPPAGGSVTLRFTGDMDADLGVLVVRVSR